MERMAEKVKNSLRSRVRPDANIRNQALELEQVALISYTYDVESQLYPKLLRVHSLKSSFWKRHGYGSYRPSGRSTRPALPGERRLLQHLVGNNAQILEDLPLVFWESCWLGEVNDLVMTKKVALRPMGGQSRRDASFILASDIIFSFSLASATDLL